LYVGKLDIVLMRILAGLQKKSTYVDGKTLYASGNFSSSAHIVYM